MALVLPQDESSPRIGERPSNFCDIVLKGGITSGVVYPLALVALSKKFRLSNIGGTSAGAIAAAAAAAAEYGRSANAAGFSRIEQVPDELGSDLLPLFQPAPQLKPWFDIFIALATAKSSFGRVFAVAEAALKGYWRNALLGSLPGVLLALLAWQLLSSGGFIVCGLMIAALGALAAVTYGLLRSATTNFVANDFGLCPGIQQPGGQSEALTDWLARLIDEASGRTDGSDPLTFGALLAPPDGRPPIHLATVTTSLMERRPYTLPMLQERRFVFERGEWSKLFPERIMAYLVSQCERYEALPEERGEFFYFPDAERLPLVVGARLSLSFPGLICCVPLWARDFAFAEEAERNKLRRCLFSDGGLSSNFPIHFFDRLLPNTPTFAISIDNFDEARGWADRVWLPTSANEGIRIPMQPVDGILGFLVRLIDSAREWQDNLQSILPGYRERIVHIGLKPEEGGLNMAMDEQTVHDLVDYGKQAGEALCDEFDLDAHRWRRFLVAMARVEETLDDVAAAYETRPGAPEGFGHFLERYAAHPSTYEQTAAVCEVLLARGRELSELGLRWRDEPTVRDGVIPKPATNLRITPKY
ncbi:patatin-like phospholipase family protein [Bradyrhizobium prioriisuperbiae]|uniref:patatin-like phospholipase family protein n=1 Tax=Bradyrhizobium prioriisuperbiae TaxID=2854389 RepID=UPI0028EAEA27|nr:patatin-like phospholipase family protein [Bradyrhizobium prioritasuperba]